MPANVRVTRPARETADQRRTSTPPISASVDRSTLLQETSNSARLYFMQYFRPDPGQRQAIDPPAGWLRLDTVRVAREANRRAAPASSSSEIRHH